MDEEPEIELLPADLRAPAELRRAATALRVRSMGARDPVTAAMMRALADRYSRRARRLCDSGSETAPPTGDLAEG